MQELLKFKQEYQTQKYSKNNVVKYYNLIF